MGKEWTRYLDVIAVLGALTAVSSVVAVRTFRWE